MYEIIRPTNEYDVNVATMKLVVRSNGISLTILIVSLMLKGNTIYNILMIVLLTYLINNGLVKHQLSKLELNLLRELENYIGDFRHYFYSSGMVEEAIYDSIEEASPNISLHMNRIYDILLEEDKLSIEQYKEIAPNKFLITFLALCQITIYYGDTIYQEQSLFLTNLNYLKNEINVEILKRNKINHVFSGLIFMTLMPVFFLKIIKNWSISNLPELEKYYDGGYGIMVSILIFIVTILVYHFIYWLKSNEKGKRNNHDILEKIANQRFLKIKLTQWIGRHFKKAYKIDNLLKRIGEGITLKQFLIQKMIIFILTMFLMNGVIFHIIEITKNQYLNYVKDFETSAYLTDRSELLIYQNTIRHYVNTYKKHEVNQFLSDKIQSAMEEGSQIKNNYVIELLADEVTSRIIQYQECTYEWYYLLFSIFLSFVCCNVPYGILLCKKQLMQLSMEDEVMQFQSIIIMLMHIKRMSIENILDWMENFSEIFKNSIVECVDTFHYDGELAFTKLKEKEPFLPFVRIVENLEACDLVGIEKAFDEISTMRSFFMDKRKQDNEMIISNKGVVGKVAAYIPLFLTLFLYLIVPFVLESISRLMSYVTQMQGIA